MSIRSIVSVRSPWVRCAIAAALVLPAGANATFVVIPAVVGTVAVGTVAAGTAAVGIAGVAALGAAGIVAGGVVGGIAITQSTIPASTFTFTQGLLPFNEVTGSTAYKYDHLELMIRAYSSDGKLQDVAISGLGVGVKSSFLEAGEVNSSLFDDPGEYLTLSFNKDVEIKTLTTTLWEDGFDNAVLSWGNNRLELGTENAGFLSDTFSFNGVVGREFKLQATDIVTSFRLAGLNVVAVPEPHTDVLFGIGILAAAWARRRQGDTANGVI